MATITTSNFNSGELTLGLAAAGVHMSPAEFDQLSPQEDGYRYELIKGVLIVNPIPSESETDANGELEYLLRSYRDNHPHDSTLNATMSERYVYLPDSRRRPDRVIWAGLGRQPDPKADVPTIVVEFVSIGRRSWKRDYLEKRDEYLALGVKEYWIIDRFDRKLIVYQSPAGVVVELVIAEQEIYRTELLPGFELPLARLLKVADAWRDSEK